MGKSKKLEASAAGAGFDEKSKHSLKGKELERVTSSATQDGKIELVHLEDVLEERAKPTWKQKLGRHWSRFWMCYIIGLVVLLAIMLPILFLVIIPALAQLIIDQTNLPIHQASIKAVSNDQVLISITTELTIPAGLTVGLDALQLNLFNREAPEFWPWTTVDVDKQSVHGTQRLEINEQLVNVGNRTELHTWLTRMVYDKEAAISAVGSSTAHLGALNFGVTLDKTITVAALRRLDGFKLNNANLVLPPRDDGTNVIGNLTLPNWSDLTIGLGNLTFNVWAGEILIGQTTVLDVLLPPGNTTLPFTGEVYLDSVMNNLVDIISSQGDALSRGALMVAVSGNQTLVDGEHITYLEGVLNEAWIESDVPITQLLSDTLQSLSDGTLQLEGINELLGGALGPLLDDLVGGEGGLDLEPFVDPWEELLDRLDENEAAEENETVEENAAAEENPASDESGGSSLLGDAFDNMESEVAKRRIQEVYAAIRARKQK